MDRDAGRILAALQNAQEQMSKINIIIVDFTFLVHMHGKELLEWLASLASSKHCKVLVCDEFLSNYELFQKSESPKQREIAVGVNNFINMLSQNRVLVLDERFRTIEHLIYKLQARSDVALFLANNSEADEVLRSCSCPRMMVVSYMTNGSLFCSSAIDYINSTQQMLLLENNDLATVLVPDFPEINSTVHTSDKTEYVLVKKVSSGAEGTVYITDNPSYVCKIYHQNNLTLEKIKKLNLLEKRQVHYDGICWPEARIFSSQGYPVGYLMKRANGQKMSGIFDGEEAIREVFANFTRMDVVNVVISVFEKIQYLHLMGVLIGDVRPQNILIDQSGNTYLIDLDSCQIEGYPSTVGDEDYTPFENQGKVFSDFLRTYRNERFSCAVLLFYILFLGQHPYAQRNGADTIGEEIAAHSFRYPKDKTGDYSLIPLGCYAEIWKFTPSIISDALYGVFKNDVRLSICEWLQLIKKYSYFLSTLPQNDIRIHLSCSRGVAFSHNVTPPPTTSQNPPKIKRASGSLFIVSLLIIMALLLSGYLILYFILAAKLDTMPPVTAPFQEISKAFQQFFNYWR